MAKPDPKAVQELSDWMIETALRVSDYEFMLPEFCDRLREMGTPVTRVSMGMTTLHPLMEAFTLLWTSKHGTGEMEFHVHASDENESWRRSPLKTLVDSGETEARYDLSSPGPWTQYPLLQDLAADGITDYVVFLVLFSEAKTTLARQDGMLTSWATDREGGFSDEQMVTLKRLIPRFGLVAKLANRERLTQNIATAYLGEKASQRVLDGQIKLGDGQNIRAVIWFSDMRNSTLLAERLSPDEYLDLLNDYFDALAGAVIKNGGEVLRFIGDAALAIFPIGEDGCTVTDASRRALRATTMAASRADHRNAARISDGREPFEYGIGLHVGDIMYGNIGVPSRIEFSVIGAAANEAARIEGLTKTLGETVLVSEAFAKGIVTPWRDLDKHAIRGSEHQITVFAPPGNEPEG